MCPHSDSQAHHRIDFTHPYLFLAADVTRDPLQNQIQLRPVPYFIIFNVDPPGFGPRVRGVDVCDPRCLERRQQKRDGEP